MGHTYFEIGQILCSKDRTKSKRLGDGSIVQCRFDTIGSHQNDDVVSIDGMSPSSSTLRSSVSASTNNDNGQQQCGTTQQSKVSFQFRVNDLNFGGGNALVYSVLDGRSLEYILQIEKWDTTENRLRWVTVYRSNPVVCKSGTSRPTLLIWDEGEVALDALCNGDFDRPLKISICQYTNWGGDAVAVCETNLNSLLNLNRKKEAESSSWFPKKPALYCNMLPLCRSGQRQQQVASLQIISAKIVGSPSVSEDYGLSEAGVIIDQALQPSWGFTGHHSQLPTPRQDSSTTDGMIFGGQHQQDSTDSGHVPAMKHYATADTSFTFHDYMNKTFCVLDLCIAIDFTSSNGDPNQMGTLHDRCSSSFNEYEETLISLGNALVPYSDGTSLWGFGAKFCGSIRHIFQCGADEKIPKSKGVHGILRTYKSVFDSGLTMSGPTVFDDIIRAAGVRARKHQITSSSNKTVQQQQQHSQGSLPHKYCVLLIITDGLAKDLQETRRQLQVYSSLPLSVVFVGVGQVNFTDLRNLCSEIRMNNHKSSQRRSNVSFVEFRRHNQDNHNHDPSSLSQVVMEELPNQLVQYMVQNGIQPPLEHDI
jgi:hypothetical protein